MFFHASCLNNWTAFGHLWSCKCVWCILLPAFYFLCQDVVMVIQLMTCGCPMALWSRMLRTSQCFCTDGWWIRQKRQITSAEWETTAPPATAPNVSPCSTRDLSLNVTTRYITQAWIHIHVQTCYLHPLQKLFVNTSV